MTREEQRKTASYEFATKFGGSDPTMMEIVALWFRRGAKWSDEHPDEQMIAKYLYEKKGYPIDLNGNLPSFEETMKDVVQYDNYKKKQWVDKACEWLKDRVEHDSIDYPMASEHLVDEFKEYMENTL